MKLKKPSKSGITEQGTVVGSAVVGAMVSDGLVSLIPAEFSAYGKPAVALATAIASASISGTSTSAKITKGALAGMSIKQGMDALRELVLSKIPKQDADSVIGNFSNKVLGLGTGTNRLAIPTNTFSRQNGMRMPLGEQAPVNAIKSADDFI